MFLPSEVLVAELQKLEQVLVKHQICCLREQVLVVQKVPNQEVSLRRLK
jgi:hypothetical protein